jgi:uncharacterized alkaline shock family protein YloU
MSSRALGKAMKVDPKEFELPETVFVRDIETKVFQSIILQCLSKIKGIALTDGNFIDSLLGRESVAGTKGIQVEQDLNNHAVNVKVEVSIVYGISIPEKAEEIQVAIARDMTKLTGLHVSCVHVVFKNLIAANPEQTLQEQAMAFKSEMDALDIEDKEYSDEF